MGYTSEYLDTVGKNIAADDAALEAARVRLKLVRDVAGTFTGSLRTYGSGSLAHHTVTAPVSDADGGLVLNRVNYPKLGPEGAGEEPREVTEALRKQLGEVIRETYPRASVTTSKRGPLVRFGAPVNGQDPTVDLVVALTRKEGSGIWIPNLEDNTWEASDPEQHVVLFSSGTTSLVANRRKVIRLLKVWNKKYAQPGFCSFHLAVLALAHLESGMSIPAALATVFEKAAADFADGLPTPDPAEVSPDIEPKVSYEVAARRMRSAAAALREALADDDDHDAVAAALAGVFPDDTTPWWGRTAATAVAAMTSGEATSVTVGVAGAAVPLLTTRAYGGGGSR